MPTQDELLLKLIAQDEASKALEEARDRLDKMTDAEKEALKASKQSEQGDKDRKKSLLEVNAALDLFGKGINAAKEFAQQAIGDTMEYAKSVRELSTNIGISVEETSKIIQAADDYGIGVGEVTSALEMMTRRGIAPSIDKLASLADQFKSIQDPVKRAEAMTEAFGRSWTTLTPLLAAGGDALRASADEAEKMGLVLSDKDVKAARELEIAADNLGDRVEALKIKIGTGLIPKLVELGDQLFRDIAFLEGTATKEQELQTAVVILTNRFGAQSDAAIGARTALREYQESSKAAADGTQAMADVLYGEYIPAMQQSEKLTTAQVDGMKALALANQTGGPVQAEYNKWLHDEANAAAAAALTMKELTTQTIFNTAAAGLDANAALVLAEKMGLVDKAALGAVKAIEEQKRKLKDGQATNDDYAASVIRIQDAIAGLKDKNVQVTIETIQREIRAQELEQRKEESGKLRAYGGAVGAGVPYIVGEQGRETFVPQQAGIVVPNNITTMITNNITTDQMGVALAMARAQQMTAEARM